MVRTSSHQAAAEGERVGLRFPPDSLHLFDAEGMRIERQA